MLLGPSPRGAPIFYQKHMTHHMLPDVETLWMASCCNVFLIRAPEQVIGSYRDKRGEISLADIGVVRQAELFDQEADRLGHAPPVIDASDILTAPERALKALCAAISIPFSEKMLAWPKGHRASDGVWAPAWYNQVEQSDGFVPATVRIKPQLTVAQQSISDAARPFYERLARWKIAGVRN